MAYYPKAVLVKPTEGVSYAAILKSLKSRVNPKELGVTVQGIRETRFRRLLVEMTKTAKDRDKLNSASREVAE